MTSFDLKRLRYFATVAELGSITKASAELYIAQPALSHQIRLLEDEVGADLFIRNTQGVRVTERGSLLLAKCHLLFAELNALREQLKSDAPDPAGQVVVGLAPTLSSVVGVALVTKCREQFPKIQLRVREVMSSEVPELVRSERVDFALTYAVAAAPGLRSVNLFDEDMFLVGTSAVAVQYFGAAKLPATLSFAALSELPLFLATKANQFRENLEHAAKAHKIRLRVIAEIDPVTLRKDLALSGIGFTILSGASLRNEIGRRDIFAVPIDEHRVRRHACFVHSTSIGPSRAAKEISRLTSEILLGILGTDVWPGTNSFDRSAGTSLWDAEAASTADKRQRT